MRLLAGLAAGALAAAVAGQQPADTPELLAFVGARVVTMADGAAPVSQPLTVVVRGDRIVELLEALREEGSTRIEDPATAAFVVHLSVEWTASRLILGGATVDIDAAVDAATDMISRYIFK